ncbi:MAG: hypothetical protein QF704_00035 [Anaerolineales bacterium]|nr:hypothetical protein [Anaerolineales bacterium]
MWYVVSWKEKRKVAADSAEEALQQILNTEFTDEEFEVEDLDIHVHNTDDPSDYDG